MTSLEVINQDLGAGHHDFDGQTCAVPTRIVRQLSSQRCLQIACGSCHTLFLTDMVNIIFSNLEIFYHLLATVCTLCRVRCTLQVLATRVSLALVQGYSSLSIRH